MQYLVGFVAFTLDGSGDIQPGAFLWLDETSPRALSSETATAFSCLDDADYAAWSAFDETELPEVPTGFPTWTDSLWWPELSGEDPNEITLSAALAPLCSPDQPRQSRSRRSCTGSWTSIDDIGNESGEAAARWHGIFVDPYSPDDGYLGLMIRSQARWSALGITPGAVTISGSKSVSLPVRRHVPAHSALPSTPSSLPVLPGVPAPPDYPVLPEIAAAVAGFQNKNADPVELFDGKQLDLGLLGTEEGGDVHSTVKRRRAPSSRRVRGTAPAATQLPILPLLNAPQPTAPLVPEPLPFSGVPVQPSLFAQVPENRVPLSAKTDAVAEDTALAVKHDAFAAPMVELDDLIEDIGDAVAAGPLEPTPLEKTDAIPAPETDSSQEIAAVAPQPAKPDVVPAPIPAVKQDRVPMPIGEQRPLNRDGERSGNLRSGIDRWWKAVAKGVTRRPS